jgi:hypothetical protein
MEVNETIQSLKQKAEEVLKVEEEKRRAQQSWQRRND